MTLYREAAGPFPEWRGESINGVTHQRNIEFLWSAAELEAIGLWRDDMIEPAAPVPDGQRSIGTTVQRVGDVVAFVHDLAATPRPTSEDIKAEASRRILDLVPDWKQRNLTAQAVILAKQVADGVPLSQEQQALWDAGQALWDRIAAIRMRSDEIEALDPIPYDFHDDGRWP